MKSRILKSISTSLFVIALSTTTMLLGCSSNSPKLENNSTSSNKTKKSDNKRLCEASLENILTVVELENLASVFQRSNGALFFNEWKAECQVEEDPKLSEQSIELLEAHFTEASLSRLKKRDFDGRDVEHLRTATLFRQMALNAVEGKTGNLQRAMALFDLTKRNISLAPAFAANVPRTPYDAMLFSLGGVEDRAWIFSILLRQLHIDSFLIRPEADSTHFLVGVPIDGETYLFDPAYGVPIASLDDKNPIAEKPATLNEVRKKQALFKQFDFEEGAAHPLANSSFEKIKLELIGDSSLWAPRMEPFELRLKGDETCTLYSAIESTDPDRELGEINRILKNGGLDESNITWGIWSFPEEMLLRYENPSPQEKEFMASVRQTFDLIFDKVVKNKNDSQSVEEFKSDRVFLKSRTRHLIGDYDTSIPSYMKFRSGARKLKKAGVNSPQANLVLQMGQQATYWSGMCKFEQENYQAAINTMENSMREYPDGIQSGPARIVKALAEAKLNQLDQAIDSFQKLPDTNPEYDMARYYIKRWKNIAGTNKKTPENNPKSEKESSAKPENTEEKKTIPPAPKTPEQNK